MVPEPAVYGPDASGQAALLLCEALIHRLKELGVLTLSDAVDVIESAADVQYDMAEAADGAGGAMREAAALLLEMADSLRQDLGDDQVPDA